METLSILLKVTELKLKQLRLEPSGGLKACHFRHYARSNQTPFYGPWMAHPLFIKYECLQA